MVFESVVECSLADEGFLYCFDESFVDEGGDCFGGDWLCHVALPG